MSRRRILVLALPAVLVLMQLVPVSRTNPPETAPIEAPPEIAALLERACFDCHSHRTKWPWYSRVAPPKFGVAHHVEEGRAEMNFSTWGDLPPKNQAGKFMQIRKYVKNREMPLPQYLWLHPEADITDAEREQLQQWALAGAQAINELG